MKTGDAGNSARPGRSRYANRSVGIGLVFAVTVSIVYFNAMKTGFVLLVAALCIFFIVVAFDIGVPKNSTDVSEP